ncbi:hypothetical protein D3C81_1607310 [compost metagenome]
MKLVSNLWIFDRIDHRKIRRERISFNENDMPAVIFANFCNDLAVKLIEDNGIGDHRRLVNDIVGCNPWLILVIIGDMAPQSDDGIAQCSVFPE